MLSHKKYHIKKNDIVMVVAGKEKGKSGRVMRVIPKKDRAIVEKLNMVKRHMRPGAQNRQGGILEKRVSNPRLQSYAGLFKMYRPYPRGL